MMDIDWSEEKEADDLIDSIIVELASSSDEEEEIKRHGTGRSGTRAKNKNRDFAAAYAKVVNDYFSGPASVYDERDFKRRFRCSRNVFNMIADKLIGQYPFIQMKDACGVPGIRPLCRLVACFRHIAYGDATDREDENMRMSEDSLRNTVKSFCKLMIQEFGPHYLNRYPNNNEKTKILEANKRRGFPGMFGSWDCKHFVWNRCPMRWQGQYQGHSEGGKRTLILEAVTDHRRYMWYANFGDAGSLNDINVLDRSSIVGAMIDGSLDTTAPPYDINGTRRDWMYFLADGIYPDWAIFVKTFSDPVDPKAKKFATAQEAIRKDVECAFGILVQKFQVLQRPLLKWYLEDISNLLHACVIIYNMTIAESGDVILSYEEACGEIEGGDASRRHWPLFGGQPVSEETLYADGVDLFAARSASFRGSMADPIEHFMLKEDLKEHLFTLGNTT